MSREFDDEPERARRPEPPASSKLRLAGPRLVLSALVLGVAFGALAVSLFRLVQAPLPVTPWTMSLLLVLLGGAAALGSVWLRRRLDDPAGPPDFEVPVAALVLGRSMLVTGLLLAGGHVAYAASQLGRLEVALYRERAIAGTAAVVAAAVFALGGYLLERACHVEPTDDDQSADLS
ncbi:DUF3180 family protein [Propionibacteriaceae bacterium Y1923]